MKNTTKPLIPGYWQAACAQLSATDPIMAEIIATYKGETLQSKGCGFTTLARSIVGQQVSVKAADTIWNRFEQAVGGVSSRNILEAEEQALRGAGLSGQKVRYLKDMAARTESGSFDFAAIAAMEEEKAMSMLCEIKGVGNWTAQMFLIFHALKPDIFPMADIGLQKAIAKHYSKSDYRSPITDHRLLTSIAQPWRPWRTVATWYLWRSLDPVPVEY